MENTQKHPNNYSCELCDFITSNLKDYKRHLNTKKHLNNQILNNLEPENPKKPQSFTCQNCEKSYKARNSLWYHEQKCKNQQEDNKEHFKDKELIMMLIKQNAQLMEQNNGLMELCKNGTVNHSNNNHTNSHNKTFNLNFFLNETCKNAMNIEDFVNQIVLNLNDLEETGRLGFAEGISKMILSRLNTLDVTERPIHCSDLKRETLYIKDKDKWEKEEETKPKLTRAVKEIAGKNMNQIFDWQKQHPDYNDPSSKTSDKYMNMVMNSMSGGTEEETHDNYEKIVSNITKETTINKDLFAV
jgi:hypothetical protein